VEEEMDEFENDPDKPCTFRKGYMHVAVVVEDFGD
jgi:hypothetical protein